MVGSDKAEGSQGISYSRKKLKPLEKHDIKHEVLMTEEIFKDQGKEISLSALELL